MSRDGRWLRPCGELPAHPRAWLACMPHAGGTATDYGSWPVHLPPGVAVISAQYPGRQERFAEPMVDRISDMVGPIVSALEPLVGQPLTIFGHSMGSYVAYEVTVALEQQYGAVVDLLVVSGAPAPHRKDPGHAHTLGDVDFVSEVARINPGFRELVLDTGLAEIVIPMVRADYRLFEIYERPDPPVLRADVLATGGDRDPEVDRAGLSEWSAVTAGSFEVLVQPGDHFYLAHDEAALVGELAQRVPLRASHG